MMQISFMILMLISEQIFMQSCTPTLTWKFSFQLSPSFTELSALIIYTMEIISCVKTKILFLEIHCGIYYIHVLLCLNTWTMDSCYYTKKRLDTSQSWGFKGLRSTLSVVKIVITWMCKKLQMRTKSFYNIQVTST